MEHNSSRRKALKNIVLSSMAGATLSSFTTDETSTTKKTTALKGNINHSACRWCYSTIPLEEFCAGAKEIGLKAIDLVGPKEWPILQKYGLHSSMCNGAEININKGWNEPKYHEQLIKNYTEMIPLVAAAGYTNLICFSGARKGMDDETGLKNCAEGLKQILPIAEKYNVVIVMELLNSKVDHKDYQCDKTAWGVELCKRTGSNNFKLLYDIYHMQIDEGDVIHTIRDFHPYIAHYHTGGVPGRHEIDETQELYYPAIMKEILKTGYKGFVAQEFIPSWPDKMAALRKGVEICDV